jgi:hypothetical protein
LPRRLESTAWIPSRILLAADSDALVLQVVASEAGKAGLKRPCLSFLLAGICLRDTYYGFLDLTGSIGEGEVRLGLVGDHLVALNQAGAQ